MMIGRVAATLWAADLVDRVARLEEDPLAEIRRVMVAATLPAPSIRRRKRKIEGAGVVRRTRMILQIHRQIVTRKDGSEELSERCAGNRSLRLPRQS